MASLLLSHLAGAAGAGRGPSGPDVQPNVRMNAVQHPFPNGLLGRAAEAIAASDETAEGTNLAAAWETLQGNCGPPMGGPCKPPQAPGHTAVGYSTDGGRTWTDAGPPPAIDGSVTAGHPWLDHGGPDGKTFFLVSRGRNLESGLLTGVLVYRGEIKDGALSWRDGRLFIGPEPGDILRSSSVAAAKDGSGKVFVAISNVRGVCGVPSRALGQIELIRSGDGGATWEKPLVLGVDDTAVTPDPQDPRCGATGTIQTAPTAATGPRGEVYVLWAHGPVFYDYIPDPHRFYTIFHNSRTWSPRIARSLDGGKTFGPPQSIVTVESLRENPPAGFSKDNIVDFPRIAVAQDGPHRGRVYVTYAAPLTRVVDLPSTEAMPVSSQVYLVASDDQGQTWTKPMPLGPPVPPSGIKRFWPSLAVQPGGAVDVVYAESQERQVTADPDDVECAPALPTGYFRRGKVSSLVDIYRVQSRDGGASFGAPLRVSSETSNWCTAIADHGGFLMNNFGDYLGVFPGRGRTYTVWTDARSGVPDAYFAEVRDAGHPVSAGR